MEDKKIIYAVDDEENIRELYACALEEAGFLQECFISGRDMFEKIEKSSTSLPSLIILDIMLDGENGFEILEKLKKKSLTQNIPVIMVSAKGEEINKVKGLNMGADDYISKPFGIMELIARIYANLRKFTHPSMIIYKDIEIDDSQHTVKVKGKDIFLTVKEFALLKYLIENTPNIMSKDKILNAVWGEDYLGETRTLDVHIANLRKLIASSSAKIITMRGVGCCIK